MVWDEINSMWDTARRALLSFDPKATYHVIVDDDALPADGFLEAVERATKALPQPTLLGLFVGEDLRLPTLSERAPWTWRRYPESGLVPLPGRRAQLGSGDRDPYPLDSPNGGMVRRSRLPRSGPTNGNLGQRPTVSDALHLAVDR